MNKILCIRFSSIGDIILTTPIIRALKIRYPSAEIHVVTKNQFVDLWAENPYIHQVHALDKGLFALSQKLRNIGFDAVIDLHKNVRSHLLCAFLLKWPYQINKFTAERKLFVEKKINRIPSKHIVTRNFESLKSLDIHEDLLGLDFFIPKGQEVNPKDFGITEPYLIYAIGAQHITKVLSYPKMVELCDRIEGQIVLIGDAWDEHFGYRLHALFPD